MKEYIDIDGIVWTENEIKNAYTDYLEDWKHEFSYLPQYTYEEFKENLLTES